MLRGKELWLAALAAILISALYGAVVMLTKEIPPAADLFGQNSADDRPREKCSPEQDIPSVQPDCVAAKHLQQERRFDESPKMASHIVRADRKKECPFHSETVKAVTERRHASPSSAKRIDINSQSEFHAAYRFGVLLVNESQLSVENRSESTACCRKKSSVFSIDFSRAIPGVQSRYRFAFRILGTRRCMSW